ncbi:LacI family DNA-binding transcriptional regulator [Streptomyces sp. NPDC057684]|uniref:LacI family DNA-binding transcriptional regulator n=1 Tax=Streptomyces sp. NPDC057684 TaxID=3346211 RepID=UPI0036A0B540
MTERADWRRRGSGSRPTSRDVAAVAGVGQATVSRVLTNDPRVSAETRQKVIDALSLLGYEPNTAARTMKTGRSDGLGVVVARLSNPRYPKILDVLGAAVARQGLNLTFWNAEYGGDLAARQAIARGVVDGVLLTTATTANAPTWQVLGAGAPVVMMNRVVPELPFDSVAVDNEAGGREIARHLVGHGRTRIACITGERVASTIIDREDGFFSELAALGHSLGPDAVHRVAFDHAAGREAMRAIMSAPEPPASVFCTNDLLALGAVDGLRSLGLSAPKDVWLTGFDDVDMAGWDSYALTTVRQPVAEMIEAALGLLQQRIADPEREVQRVWMPAELVVRQSTAGG